MTSKAAIELRYCTKLFSLEKKYCDADEKSREDYRQNVVWPLLEEYFSWLKGVHPEKGSKLEDAVWYSMNQKQQLMIFPAHGKVPISNNLVENAVRPFVVGRKNWLFCDSVKGAPVQCHCVFTGGNSQSEWAGTFQIFALHSGRASISGEISGTQGSGGPDALGSIYPAGMLDSKHQENI